MKISAEREAVIRHYPASLVPEPYREMLADLLEEIDALRSAAIHTEIMAEIERKEVNREIYDLRERIIDLENLNYGSH